MQTGGVGKLLSEGANVKALRTLMIGLAALVVLAVSGYGTVIYIQLMGKVFPTGPLLIAWYIGAAANFLLMLVLLAVNVLPSHVPVATSAEARVKGCPSTRLS